MYYALNELYGNLEAYEQGYVRSCDRNQKRVTVQIQYKRHKLLQLLLTTSVPDHINNCRVIVDYHSENAFAESGWLNNNELRAVKSAQKIQHLNYEPNPELDYAIKSYLLDFSIQTQQGQYGNNPSEMDYMALDDFQGMLIDENSEYYRSLQTGG